MCLLILYVPSPECGKGFYSEKAASLSDGDEHDETALLGVAE